jgi:hypothetical protein
VFILSEEKKYHSPEEKDKLFILKNILGGLVLTSDNVANYSNEILRQYLSHFPLREKSIELVKNEKELFEIRFSIGSFSYVAFTNMGDNPTEAVLPNGAFCRNDSRTGDVAFLSGNSRIALLPHESRCFLHISETLPCLAGSSGHMFPASEIETVKASGKNFIVKFHKKARKPIVVYIRVAKSGKYQINGTAVESNEVLPGVHIIKAIVE